MAAIRAYRSMLVHLVLLIGLAALVANRPRQVSPFARMTVEELVEGLASKNLRERQTLGIFHPSEYDLEHQFNVKQCFDELIGRGKESFPVLIDHLNDDRFSCVYHSEMIPRDFPQNVGSLCYMALYLQVRPCPTYLHSGGRPLGKGSPTRIPACEDASTWFEKRKDWSLLQIQREAWQASIDFVKSDAYGQSLSKMQHTTPSSIEWSRDEDLQLLTWCLRYLDEAGKPMRVSVPWTIVNSEPMITAASIVEIDPVIAKKVGQLPVNATTSSQ